MDTLVFTVIVVFITFTAFINVIRSESDDDSVAMLKLASSLHGAPESWSNKTGSNYCSWEGVECDQSSRRVIGIDLSYRNLTGTLPAELSTLSQLRNLSFEGNGLSGALPSLANLSFLRELRLGVNAFTTFPSGFFHGLTGLQVFNISQNENLNLWNLPPDLANCTSLVVFDASKASVMAVQMPDIFSSLRSLRELDLSFNLIVGTLPTSFANSNIQKLRLNSLFDLFAGYEGIDVLASMTELRESHLSLNLLTGTIPDFSHCKNLYSLNLYSNSITGLIPDTLVSHPSLRILTLSENYLQGPIPLFPIHMKVTLDGNSFCNDTMGAPCDPVVTTFINIAAALHYPLGLAQNWRGNNACSFDNFVTCDEQQKVIIVNLTSQSLDGMISQDFCNLTDLRNLTLNDNYLTGPIPECLTKLPDLELLDVSNNNISGPLPKFSPSVKLYFEDNPLLTKLNHSRFDPKKPSNVPQKLANRRKKYVIVGIAVAVFLSVMSASSIYLFKKRFNKSVNRIDYIINEDGILSHIRSKDTAEARNTSISIKFLQQATCDFSDANILGRGGSGVVYKGELNDGTCIAVKRMEATNELRGFEAEIRVLTRVRHRRLVALLGYCINQREKMLVYEYMPQGSLRQHLFEWCERNLPPLSWTQRVTIVLDVARGVEYLHSLTRETFIHRDLKPSNILLGDDMRAKVSDFGLVKTTSGDRNSTETKVAGTFGYFAPEYAATGKVTTKVDVYAFGVIMMEMITGKKAVDETASDDGWMSMHLVTWFCRLLAEVEDISAVIDKTLHPEGETLLSIIKMAKLAGQCCSPKPNQRPEMSHVVNSLACLVEQWTPPSPESIV